MNDSLVCVEEKQKIIEFFRRAIHKPRHKRFGASAKRSFVEILNYRISLHSLVSRVLRSSVFAGRNLFSVSIYVHESFSTISFSPDSSNL